jgi:adenine-specific DNA-methyltransferase
LKTSDRVSADKLRGGFYTPPDLVRVCLERVSELVGDRNGLVVLEPSSGDGAFIRGLSGHRLAAQVSAVTAIELLDAEADKCRRQAPGPGFELDVITGSALRREFWRHSRHDVAVGNPPFVRFQFVTPDDVAASAVLARHLGLSFAGVSNLWLPVFLAALSALKDGGVFAFVVPAEFFTGISAGVARRWLTEHTRELRVDLFPVGSFPGVMQEVVVVSGAIRRAPRTRLLLEQHSPAGASRRWSHDLSRSAKTWTGYLLKPEQLALLAKVRSLADLAPLGSFAKFEVATVTGANEFFTVDERTLDAYRLHQWTLPLLPRVRHAPGLRFTDADYKALREAGARAYLLDFSADRPRPSADGPQRYLRGGEELGLPARYKCRIRTPWYRVPVMPAGSMMLSKRSHRYPRVILNEVNAYTTDTIYRGRMVPTCRAGGARNQHSIDATDLVASFHNSLTLLTAEIEGRSFGGGVLELVPSEVSRLLVPVPGGFGDELDRLDAIARATGQGSEEYLVEETDRLLVKRVKGLDRAVMEQLSQARLSLQSRRMDRNAVSAGTSGSAAP